MKIVNAGNRIILDEGGSFIEDKATGRESKIWKDRGEFKFDRWVPKAKSGNQIENKPKKTVTINDHTRFSAPTRSRHGS